MSLHPATVLKCDGGADVGTKCERRFVSFADMFVCKDDIKRLKKRGWTQVSARHYCPECSCDPDRREGKRPQYQGPKTSETPQRVGGGSPLRSGDSVPASARGVSPSETRR